MQKTAVLFQTHFFDRWAAAAFRRLRAGAPAHFDFIVVIHLPPGAAVPPMLQRIRHHVVRTPELRALPYPVKTGGGSAWSLWWGGHTDLIAMHFLRAHRGYDRYWSIEYDVAFSGPWRRFFAAFEEDDSDLLAPVIYRRRDVPEWRFWNTLSAPGVTFDEEQALHSFMPIFRASGRLVEAVDTAYCEGWGGHCECSWATIAAHRGFSVADIGGEGEFTAPRNRGRFYTSTPNDVDLTPGTMIFYPRMHRVGSRPDMLWHPVKPLWIRDELRRDLLAGRSTVATQLRQHAPWLLPQRWRTPGSFTRSPDGAPNGSS